MIASTRRPDSAASLSSNDGKRSTPGDDFFDVVARVFVVALFLLLAISIAQDFLRTTPVTGLLLLTNQLLVVVLMSTRRCATQVDRSASARLLTVTATICPLLLRPSSAGRVVPDALAASVSCIGVLVAIAGQLSLGRSFGLVPANRGIICSGMYRIVRHPIYAGYILAHIGFLFANPTVRNAVFVMCGDALLALRVTAEERTLRRDELYMQYARRVRWRLVPGIY